MGLLYRLEEEFEGTVRDQLQQALQEALDLYRAMCKSCDLAMHRHHSYERRILTRHGELQMTIPVFLCGQCGGMLSGMELIGAEEMRKRYSKKRVRRP